MLKLSRNCIAKQLSWFVANATVVARCIFPFSTNTSFGINNVSAAFFCIRIQFLKSLRSNLMQKNKWKIWNKWFMKNLFYTLANCVLKCVWEEAVGEGDTLCSCFWTKQKTFRRYFTVVFALKQLSPATFI